MYVNAAGCFNRELSSSEAFPDQGRLPGMKDAQIGLEQGEDTRVSPE
jgi:hypothetical protein